MSSHISSSVPTISLSSLSEGRFMLRPSGPRETVMYHRHRDDYYMFGVMLSGKQTLSVDFCDITVEEQQAVIVSPGQVHRPVGGTSTEGFVLAFPPESMTESETILIEEYSLRTLPLALSDDDFNSVKSLYEVLLQRINRNSDVEFSIASAIKGIVLQQITQYENTFPGRYLRIAIDLRKLLKDNISIVKSPTEYASLLNISGVYLNEAIKNVTGMSVSAYIISYAILVAKRKLAYTTLSAQEIAYQLGYEDYSYFSRLFRKQTGMSPRTFRQKYLE